MLCGAERLGHQPVSQEAFQERGGGLHTEQDYRSETRHGPSQDHPFLRSEVLDGGVTGRLTRGTKHIKASLWGPVLVGLGTYRLAGGVQPTPGGQALGQAGETARPGDTSLGSTQKYVRNADSEPHPDPLNQKLRVARPSGLGQAPRVSDAR